MIVTRLRSEDLAPADRFPLWHDLTRSAHYNTIIDSPHRADFAASILHLDFGWTMQATTIGQPALTAIRTERVVRGSDPEVYQIAIPIAGTLVVDHCRRESVVGVGQALLVDSSRPGSTLNQDGYVHIVLQVPKALLRSTQAERLVNQPIDMRGGVGSALVAVLGSLMARPESYGPADGARMAMVVVDLLTAMLSPSAPPSGDHGREVLRTRVLAFIQQNLGDPALSPGVIAAAHQISVRALHALFKAEGTTVSRWIHDRRLERCRRDLADPAHAARPAYAIGARWGFPDAAAFNRAFRAAYGLPPGEFRRLATPST